MEIDGFVFVTGGGSGIGKACCYALAKEGASGVMVADLNAEAAKEVIAGIKGVASCSHFRAEAIKIDVSLEESVKAAIAHTVEAFGRIDYAVHCAGVPGGSSDPIADASFVDFKRLMEVNVHGTFLVTSLVSAAMKSQNAKQVSAAYPERGTTRGSIVNLASITSHIAVPRMVQYTTSKHAVLGITKIAGKSRGPMADSLIDKMTAIDNIPHGIRVNCVCPTWTDTPLVQRAMEVVPGLEHSMLSGIPMGRLCRAEEVADTVLYLCSSRSSFTTEASLILDGGMSLGART